MQFDKLGLFSFIYELEHIFELLIEQKNRLQEID